MKKKILGAAFIAAMALTAGWNFNQSKNEIMMSKLALANVEALARNEGESGTGTCYKTITTQKGSKILYCSTCTYIKDSTNSWTSGTGQCT